MRSQSAALTVTSPPTGEALILREGELLGGRYRVERFLGGGGMGMVYRAIHCGLDQPVAVKIVPASMSGRHGVISRFMREARAATSLKGEHVVRVFDVGISLEGMPYLVMELLEGKDLGETLSQGWVPSAEEATDYALQACEALAEVHGLGIVHRDLKPDNLFIARAPDGRACVKLIDFGISRIESPLSPNDAPNLTRPGIALGTPRYMPPEQMVSPALADCRSDIWGLGATLYEMLVGNAPFDGGSLGDSHTGPVGSPPPAPSSVNADVPEALDEVVLKCLRADPEERFADVAELAAALAPFGGDTAAVRADAVARLLEASRARRRGEAEGPLRAHARSSSSGIRRRPSFASRFRRRRRATLGTAALLLVGIGLAAGPIARKVGFTPGIVVTDAVAALQLQSTSLSPTPMRTRGVAVVKVTGATLLTTAARPRAAPTPIARAAPPIRSLPSASESVTPKADLAAEPALSSEVQTPRADERD